MRFSMTRIIEQPKSTSLFRYFHMYRTFTNSKLLGSTSDGSLVFHDIFPELGGAVVDHIV